ncbi:Co2+/Mg2+ efflux protein ApaG [Rickettsiales endosymbiont of Stachyamoeba lipophora]|uniref:Co2+/Mg2+ efflux protein ApaG n=1 Tax=Rickettsiales endosymbiont of Stachyamoeba lipophora TaxID=2486578 RepID=UPI000F656147|nr:Co2+/Mg2+ efflux protein ApaG [Rickettsiales endosymbiont of Stachyamoeba lipophora]AZL15087.1 Co2+/Mg2+ efflux protein ApaG [Rickettsiales endosymbiont of Stachyamoeba lipophora]
MSQKLSKIVYSHTESDIKITVSPEYNPEASSPFNLEYVWNYHIIIENLSVHKIQLLSRFWNIIDKDGCIKEIEGEGVVGLKPVIDPKNKFDYNSYTLLHTPSGIMAGEYEILDLSNNKLFYLTIPTFSLDIPNETHLN